MYIKKSEQIPFAYECEFEDYKNHREDILKEFGETHPSDVLITHHTDKNTFIHYTKYPKSVSNHGILLDKMNALYNDFGGNIHCFTADCPDGKWSGDLVYFTADEWWMCIANKDTNFNIRHCIINKDISPENIKDTKPVEQLSPKDYMKYFGYTQDEINQMDDSLELIDLATAHNNGTLVFKKEEEPSESE